MTVRSIPAALAIAAAVLLLSIHPGQAFTLDNQSGNNTDGSPRFADPDEQVDNFGRTQEGERRDGPTVRFGTQQPDQSRNSNINPAFRPLGSWSFGNHD